MKYKILTITALIGSAVAELFGGWDTALQTLVVFMAIDWITGGIILPGVFGKSRRNIVHICWMISMQMQGVGITRSIPGM